MRWAQPSTTLGRPNVTDPGSFRSDPDTKTFPVSPDAQWRQVRVVIDVEQLGIWARSGVPVTLSNKSDERDPEQAWFWSRE
jgi:hypothetical protein